MSLSTDHRSEATHSLFGLLDKVRIGFASSKRVGGEHDSPVHHVPIVSSDLLADVGVLRANEKGAMTNTPIRRRKRMWHRRKTSGKSTSTVASDVAPTLVLSFTEDETSRDASSTGGGIAINDTAQPQSMSRRKAVPPSPYSSPPSARQQTPAAVVAASASAAKPEVATAEVQARYHRNARLNVKQAADLVRLCSQQIKMRGLATIGIFRPFRASESVVEQERLIELFLRYSDPKTYEHVFAAGQADDLALLWNDKLQASAETELKKKLAYANVFDLIALLKWGLRRMQLKPADLSKSSGDVDWYDDFVEKERNAGYPMQAYSLILLSEMPADTTLLFDSLFDLMSTVSAHHIANAMAASKICRILGFWLFARVGQDHMPHNLPSLLQAWEKSTQMTEHLFMVFVRDQASKIHLMPSRLMEVVAGYPNIDGVSKIPIIRSRFAPMSIKTLLVEAKSDNVIVPTEEPRGPSKILRAALKAQGGDADASEELDDWSAILGVACNGEGMPDPALHTIEGDINEMDHDIDARKELAIFDEDDARILQIVSAELQRKRLKLQPKETLQKELSQTSVTSERLNNVGRISNTFDAPSSLPTSSSLASSQDNKYSSLRASASQLGTLDEDSRAEPSLAWTTFSAEGFNGKENNGLDLKLDDVYQSVEEDGVQIKRREALRRQASSGTLRRRKAYGSNQFGSLSSSRLHDTSFYHADVEEPPTPHYSLQKVSTVTFDECFAMFWQDQLLDDCAASRLPHLLIGRLNAKTASRLLSTGVGQSQGSHWLTIVETLIPPRPNLPMSHSGSARHFGKLRRGNSIKVTGPWDDAMSDKKSIAPSMRSTWTSGKAKARGGVRRMTSMLSVRSRADARQAEKERLDKEVAELQQAVRSSRRLSPAPVGGQAFDANSTGTDTSNATIPAAIATPNHSADSTSVDPRRLSTIEVSQPASRSDSLRGETIPRSSTTSRYLDADSATISGQ